MVHEIVLSVHLNNEKLTVLANDLFVKNTVFILSKLQMTHMLLTPIIRKVKDHALGFPYVFYILK